MNRPLAPRITEEDLNKAVEGNEFTVLLCEIDRLDHRHVSHPPVVHAVARRRPLKSLRDPPLSSLIVAGESTGA